MNGKINQWKEGAQEKLIIYMQNDRKSLQFLKSNQLVGDGNIILNEIENTL